MPFLTDTSYPLCIDPPGPFAPDAEILAFIEGLQKSQHPCSLQIQQVLHDLRETLQERQMPHSHIGEEPPPQWRQLDLPLFIQSE